MIAGDRALVAVKSFFSELAIVDVGVIVREIAHALGSVPARD
jgi:hypothetical protein